ncbi:MAG TPA: ExbD/TolR family protein [Stellaceae bacterium]|nr:ExbD/TolR family protein [Stellaceae bacterium]
MAISPPPGGDPDEKAYTPLAEINVTPMVDVMLVLLVIFMVTAPLLTVGVPVELPKTSAAKATEPTAPLVVSIDKAGDTFIGDEKVAANELNRRLRELALADPERVVYVRGDRAISYAHVMDLLGQVNSAGFAHVSLLAEAAPSQ